MMIKRSATDLSSLVINKCEVKYSFDISIGIQSDMMIIMFISKLLRNENVARNLSILHMECEFSKEMIFHCAANDNIMGEEEGNSEYMVTFLTRKGPIKRIITSDNSLDSLFT